MKTIATLVLTGLSIFLFSPPPISARPGQEKKQALERQDELKREILTFDRGKDPARYKKLLSDILKMTRDLENKDETRVFLASLLDSIKYKDLYSHIYYCLSGLFEKKMKEHYLLKSLEFVPGNKERQSALTRLYEYYKKEQTGYLELSYLQKLIEIQKVNNDLLELENSYNDLATYYRDKGEYPAALDYYFTALEYSKLIEEDHGGFIYLNISEVFRTINRNQLARKYLQQAMAYAKETGNRYVEAYVLHSGSQLEYEAGNYHRALELCDRGLAIRKELNIYNRASAPLHRKAMILIDLGREQEAMSILKQAIDLGLETKGYKNLLYIMVEYVTRLADQGRLDEVDRYLGLIDDIYAPYYSNYFFYYYLKAIFYEAKKNRTAALSYYRKSLSGLDQYFSSSPGKRNDFFIRFIRAIYSRAIAFYLDMYRSTGREIFIKRALYLSEIQNSYTHELYTLQDKRYSNFKEEQELLETELLRSNNEYIRLLKEGGDKNRLSTLERKLSELQDQHEELKEFILEMPIKYQGYKFKDMHFSQIQSRLKPGQLVIKFCLLKKKAYALFINRNNLGYRELDAGSDTIIGRVNELTEPLEDLTRGSVDYLRVHYDLKLAHQMYGDLLQPILERLPKTREIFIIPDRELFKLPFGALVTGFYNRELDPGVIFSEYSIAEYLLEKYSLSYYLSLFHLQKKFAPGSKAKYLVSAFGAPVIENHPGGTTDIRNGEMKWLCEIPSAGKEISRIREIFDDEPCLVFPRDSFTKGNFIRFAPQSRILHIATHFINNLNYPQYSALMFSPSPSGNPFFYAHEVFNLKLNAELVFLSACESSEKHLLGIQGLRGMTASFRHAGARSIIVSMWPVDEVNSRLIPEFYKEYLACRELGSSRAITRALRQAKLKLMKRSETLKPGLKISFSHPFLWANFIHYHLYY